MERKQFMFTGLTWMNISAKLITYWGEVQEIQL